MKNLISKMLPAMFACFAFTLHAGDDDSEKQFIDARNLSINEHGIFVSIENEMIPLDSISYDYSAKSYYVSKNEVRLVKCPCCGHHTYDPATRKCYYDRCPYYPYLNSK